MTSQTTFKNGDIVAIKSKDFNNVYLRLDGNGCNADNRACGTVNASYGKASYEKFVLMKNDANSFCLYNMAFPLVFLKFNGSECTTSNGGGCGLVKGYFGETDTTCPEGTALKFVYTNGAYGLQSVSHPNAYIRLDGNSVNSSKTNGGTVNGQFYATGAMPAAWELFTVEVEANITDKLKELAAKYSPYVYIHKDEKHFPVAIGTLGVSWPSDLSSTTTKIQYNYGAGSSFDNNAPLYVSFTRESSGFNVNYGVLQAYNDCGPEASVTAKVVSPAGTVGVSDTRVTLCPGGVHNGDFEHVSISFTNEFALNKIKVGYHSGENEYTSSQISWDGTHPVVFMAKGSHALYGTTGQQKYHKLWEESSGSTENVCPDICYQSVSVPYPCGVKTCKKWGVPYPCGVKTCTKTESVPYPCTKSCWVGATTSGWFIDFAPDNTSTTKWTPQNRYIYSGVALMDNSGLSNDEINLAKYQGRFGVDIDNNGWDLFKASILGITSPVTSVCSSCKNAINSALSAAESEYESQAPTSIATKHWWKQN